MLLRNSPTLSYPPHLHPARISTHDLTLRRPPTPPTPLALAIARSSNNGRLIEVNVSADPLRRADVSEALGMPQRSAPLRFT